MATRFSSRRDPSTTFAPSRSATCATSRPSPVPTPDTTMVLPSSSIAVFLLFRRHVGAGDAAVDEERRRGDERRVVAREERDRGRDLGRLGEAAHRDVHEPPRRALGIRGEELFEQRRVHRAGAQRVDADAVAGELHAELAAQREHAALRRGVRDLRRRGAQGRDERRGVDDRAPARGLHVRDHHAAAQVHRREVHVLHAAPRVELGGRGSSRRRAARSPRC